MTNRYVQLLLNTALIRSVEKISRRTILPGFDGLPLYDVGSFFIKGIMKGGITMRASSLSFSFFLAIFPSIIFFFTLIPFIPIENMYGQVISILSLLLPNSAIEAVRDTIEDIVTNKRSGLLSLGFLFALYFSTSGIIGIMEAFNSAYYAHESRSFIKQRLMAILLVFILSVLIFAAIALITLGSLTIDLLDKYNVFRDYFTLLLLVVLKWVSLALIVFFAISFLYYFAPVKKSRFRFFSAGSTLATIGTMLTCILFNWYINNFSRYNVLYGSIGTLLILLFWIYLNANILLIGFELNASIGKAKSTRDEPPEIPVA